MLDFPFDVDEIEDLFRALAHSHRELRKLTADIFFEGVALPVSHFLNLPVGVVRER